jgi:outer membrane protein TolC
MIVLLLNLITFVHADSSPFFGDLDNFKNKNLNLQTEAQSLKASNDLLLSRRLFWTPKISISLDKNRTRIDNAEVTDYDSITGDVSLNLFKGGSDWNKMKGAKAQNNAQELQVLNENLKVEVKASDLIFRSLYITESQRIEEQLLKLKEESYKIVKDRYGQGKIPLQEVTKAEVDLVQQKNKLRTAVLELSENKSRIASLFINTIQTKFWPFNEKTMPKLSESSKLPISEQKFWISQSKEQTWRATKGLHWPSLDLHLQYQESPIKDRTNKQLVGIMSLSFPLWNRYETTAEVSAAYADYIGALNDYQDTNQDLQQRTMFLKEKIETARLNLFESKRNLDLTKKLYEDILRSFKLGRISTNDLIIEQNRLLESENSLALNQLTFHQGIIEACTLSGIKALECLE